MQFFDQKQILKWTKNVNNNLLEEYSMDKKYAWSNKTGSAVKNEQ